MINIKYDVFISYSSSDRPAVAVLDQWLREEKFTTFFDRSDLIAGEEWLDDLPEALASSAVCAVVIGPGDKVGWQSQEVKLALIKRIRNRDQDFGNRFRVIPILLPGASPPGEGESSAFDFLPNFNWVRFEKSLDELYPRHCLICGIKGIKPGPHPDSVIVTGECPYRGLDVFNWSFANSRSTL